MDQRAGDVKRQPQYEPYPDQDEKQKKKTKASQHDANSIASGLPERLKGKEVAREFRGARGVVAPEEVVGAGVGYVRQKIGERSEFGVAGAAVIERTNAQEGKLGAVIAEFIHLRVIELDDADQLRRGEEPAPFSAQTAVGREAGVRREPARDRGRADGMAMDARTGGG